MKGIIVVLVSRKRAEALKLLIPQNDIVVVVTVAASGSLLSEVSRDGAAAEGAESKLRTLPANLDGEHPLPCTFPQQIAALEGPHKKLDLVLSRYQWRPWPPLLHHLHHHLLVLLLRVVVVVRENVEGKKGCCCCC